MDTKKLRQKILDLAIRGKLVPQDPNDEPASVLLERIRTEKQQLIKEGKIKAPKGSKACDTSHYEKVEGPFEIPESWEWVRLGDISNYGQCENVDVSRISPESWTLELEDIEKDTAKIVAFQNIKKRPLKGVRHRFLAGDVLYSKLRTYLNKVLVAPKDGYCTTEIIPIKSYSGVSSSYMCYVLRSNYYLDYTSSLGFGVKMPRLSTNDAIKSLIPIPPYNEQIRIVKAIQDACDPLERIESAQENVTRQISLIKSKILSLAISGDLVPQDPSDEPAIELLKRINPDFKPCDNSHYENLPQGWIKCRLSDVAIIRDSLRSPINSQERAKRIVKAKFLYPYYGATGEVGKIDDYLLNGEYLLLGEDGAPFLEKYATKAYVISGKAWVNNHAHILEPLCNINYLKNFLNCLDYKPYVKGSTRLKLTQSDMMKITIFLPPIEEQNRIVRKVNELLGLIKKISVSV